jgi:hypothetical protein
MSSLKNSVGGWSLTVVVALGSTNAVQAQFINGGFETGTYSSWSLTGTGYVVGPVGTPAIMPPSGNFQGGLQTDGAAPAFGPNGIYTSVSGLELFFGLAGGTLDSIRPTNSSPTFGGGSGLFQTVTVNAGDTLTLEWDFVTREVGTENIFNDFAFVVIGGTAMRLQAVNDLVNGPLTGPTVFMGGDNYRTSAYQTFNFVFNSGGTFNIGLGVISMGDDLINSGLAFDDFRLSPVPEPSGLALLAAAGGMAGLWSLRRRQFATAC